AAATTVSEARAAEAAGADAVVAQGMEAGGHRVTFEPRSDGAGMVGLFSLIPAVADAVAIPVIAAGGIADGRGVAAALTLGASAVQIGTAFLRAPEAQIPQAWADGLAEVAPEDTIVTRAFSGRQARSLPTAYARAATAPDAPEPAPYPIQNNLTQAMRAEAARTGDLDAMTAWAGQSARLARAAPAAEIVKDLWADAKRLLA
ncbi:MAG: nitronate monooxygenase, partial [Pseudomonadota bacterium]